MTREELLQNAKPILFSTPMVQAIITGNKRQTRRICKSGLSSDRNIHNITEINTCTFNDTGFSEHDDKGKCKCQNTVKPQHKKGDILYVRETFADVRGLGFVADDGVSDATHIFRADEGWEDEDITWKPSIFMPKKIARIFLRITNVRVERLQDITDMEIHEEGIRCPVPNMWSEYSRKQNRLMQWKNLWDLLNTKRGYSWESNPWVFVYEFEHIKEEQ